MSLKKRTPFVTLILAAIALAIHVLPGAATWLQFDRVAIASGECWRLFSGHLTHWNTDHLFWDLLMFVVLGVLIEARSRTSLLWTILLATLIIATVAWLRGPGVQTYRGLSGIDTALFVFLACSMIIEAIHLRQWHQCIVPGVLLVLAMGKFGYEAVTGSTLFVDNQSADFVVFLEAHLVGVAVGALTATTFWPQISPKNAVPS